MLDDPAISDFTVNGKNSRINITKNYRVRDVERLARLTPSDARGGGLVGGVKLFPAPEVGLRVRDEFHEDHHVEAAHQRGLN